MSKYFIRYIKYCILLLFAAQTSFAQQRQVSFSEIDERVKSIDPAPPAQLAYTLTKDYASDQEKLRSIFSWITDHIAYRVKNRYGIQAASHTSHFNFIDTATKWKPGIDVLAENVLQNKTAICDGYARLFKLLCDYAGLRCAVIVGFGGGDYNRHAKFRCNHTWNAVYIDSAWHLMDVTWASGYTNYRGDEFIKRYDETYFMAAPQNFIRDHFPDDLRWTLMENPPFPHEFNGEPYRNSSFIKYSIAGFSPAGGIIEAAVGDTVQIDLQPGNPQADSKIAPDSTTNFDSSLEKINSTVEFLQPPTAGNKKWHYSFYVQDGSIEWLDIVYNHDIVLRYRLNIKKEKNNLAKNNPTAISSNPASQ